MSLPPFFDIHRRRRHQDRRGVVIYSTREFCDLDPKLANYETEIQERIDELLVLDAEVFDLKAERDRERSDFKFR